ncbi:hypothetical protein O181_013346 [Austropuccinia psidii MF-1]|uniref:Uncharacterized protein n=1 Tax=Austropuccinia psidii MF-1 TaxID=1389203 RepID=A0A9Q3BZI7_9BASI|nr:hypothetical protein [Austropuccinia psidii MF-1]
MPTISCSDLNRNPSIQSSISPSQNQSRHQQSQIGINSLLLQSSLKKNRNGKFPKYWIHSSREESYGVWWNGKFSVKTQKDSLGNQPKTSGISLNLSRTFIICILIILDKILQELEFLYDAWWGEELPNVSPTAGMHLEGYLYLSCCKNDRLQSVSTHQFS